MRARWLVLIAVAAVAWSAWWVGQNPLPDGFQNEYLHVGNAYDLWSALVDLDQWHLRWYMYTGYWPWGFYAVPWPFLALGGLSRAALVAGNLVHLAVLLWAVNSLGRAFGARLAPLLVVLCPGVFGSMVRFEPNLAAIAWVAAGLAFLVRSNGLRQRREVLGWGAALGLGLMMDRLTVAFFLLPAALPLLWPELRWPGGPGLRRLVRNLGLGLLVALVLSGAYYREFFLRQTGELLSQAPVGEIDAAGTVSLGSGHPAWYLLALLDSQAGPVLGALMLVGLLLAARQVLAGRRHPGTWQPPAVLLAAVLAPLLLFGVIAKKQVYYTLPILAPLAVLAAAWGRWAWLGVAGGLWVFAGTGLGLAPRGFPGSPWMPEDLVAPRHTLARPPTGPVRGVDALDHALAAVALAPLCGGDVAVLSGDETLFEGFVTLRARERLPGWRARGVVLDPVGTYELMGRSGALLRVGRPGLGWPDAAAVEVELLHDHYDLRELPPVAREVERAGASFEERGRWRDGEVEIALWVRTSGGLCGEGVGGDASSGGAAPGIVAP